MDSVFEDLVTAVEATGAKIERLQQIIEQKRMKRIEEGCQKSQHSQN